MVQGQVFLKKEGGGGGGMALFVFNFFKVYQFYMQKLLYPLENCVMYLRKKVFFCQHNFMKKSHSKLSKNEPGNMP